MVARKTTGSNLSAHGRILNHILWRDSMFKRLLGFLVCLSTCITCQAGAANAEGSKHVLLAILARNKAHILPLYLSSIENLQYEKKDITVYINTNNNEDETREILEEWITKKGSLYRKIIFESHEVPNLSCPGPNEWTCDRLHALALIRNKSLSIAKEERCDYYFVIDCDNFVIPSTLADLVAKDLPIVAPMLRTIPEPGDINSNFFYEVTETGYFKGFPNEYFDILNRAKIGTFKMPLVQCTYLIKCDYLDKLSYTDDTQAFEFIIFSRTARKNRVGQYICNEKFYGYNVNYYKKLSLTEEKISFQRLIPKIQALLSSDGTTVDFPSLQNSTVVHRH